MPTIRQKQSTYAITILAFQRHRHFQRTANAELFIARSSIIATKTVSSSTPS